MQDTTKAGEAIYKSLSFQDIKYCTCGHIHQERPRPEVLKKVNSILKVHGINIVGFHGFLYDCNVRGFDLVDGELVFKDSKECASINNIIYLLHHWQLSEKQISNLVA